MEYLLSGFRGIVSNKRHSRIRPHGQRLCHVLFCKLSPCRDRVVWKIASKYYTISKCKANYINYSYSPTTCCVCNKVSCNANVWVWWLHAFNLWYIPAIPACFSEPSYTNWLSASGSAVHCLYISHAGLVGPTKVQGTFLLVGSRSQ